MTTLPPRRRRRAWPWLVSVAVVVGLIVAAWFLGEWIARDAITKTIQQQVVTRLALPADQDVHVEIQGAVLPQLIGGSFDRVQVASQDVTVQDFAGDVAVTLRDVSVRDLGAMSDGSATVRMDQSQLRGLMAKVDGFPADTLGLAAPNVTATSKLTAFGASVPVGIALTPSAAGGDIVLKPASLTLGGAKVTAGDLRARFGPLADAVLRDWPVCIASSLPKGLVLKGVRVVGARLVADFTVDGRIAKDSSLRAKGSCA